MNYRHAFHAGNFADVHKHVVLLAALARLQRKSTPLVFIDTHAGRGSYELHDAPGEPEWRNGIGRLFNHAVNDVELQRYLQTIQAFNPEHRLQHYPGSPLLAAHRLRPIDRLICIEQQPDEARALRVALGKRGAELTHGDGYVALQRLLPPKENRGLVLIDPPYEDDQEFTTLQRALTEAVARWRNGVFACWYPLKVGQRARRFHVALAQTGLRKLLLAELAIHPEDSPVGLNGSGMLLVNPPWQLDTDLPGTLRELHPLLAPARTGGVRVEWLVPE